MNNPVIDRAETALRLWKLDADKGIQRVIVNPAYMVRLLEGLLDHARDERDGEVRLTLIAWPEGISNGLTLDCGTCGLHTDFDYRVSDEIWHKVAPEHLRLGVICLSCFDKMAAQQGIDISPHLEQVQYTGVGKTVVLKPIGAHLYNHYDRSFLMASRRSSR